MRYRDLRFPALAAVLVTSLVGFGAPLPAANAFSSESSGEDLPFPPHFFGPAPGSGHPAPGTTHPTFGLDGTTSDHPEATGRKGDAGQGDAKADAAADAEPAPKPPTRAEILDKLMDRLAKATDPDEAQGIAGSIEHMWMRSGSDTADLLMSRVVAAINGNRHDVAEALLEQILVLEPDWAEAWNKRATLRFLDNDDAGSMEDISHVLVLEPRHFGAISGMGFILERHGEDAAALTALRRALQLYPENEAVRKAVEKLTPEVEGHDL